MKAGEKTAREVAGLTNPEEVRRRLDANLAQRGYLLPHQGLMAVAMPELTECTCLPMWATGMNRTIDATQMWIDLVRNGRVHATEPFLAWASADQGPCLSEAQGGVL